MEIETKLQLNEQTRILTDINSHLRLIRYELNYITKKNLRNIILNYEVEDLDNIIDELSLVIEKIIRIAMFGRYDDGSNR